MVWGTAVLWIVRLRDIFFVVYADNCRLDFGDKIDEKRYLDSKRIEENQFLYTLYIFFVTVLKLLLLIIGLLVGHVIVQVSGI